MQGNPTQADFAKQIWFSKTTVQRYESDARGTTREAVVRRWAEVTGYDYEWLEHGVVRDGPNGDGGALPAPVAGGGDSEADAVTIRYSQAA